MIFGFNTDVKCGSTSYHVQSEARESDQTIQTQVFIRGRCLGKWIQSFAGVVEHPERQQLVHDMLREQHREVVDAAREGRIEELLRSVDSLA